MLFTSKGTEIKFYGRMYGWTDGLMDGCYRSYCRVCILYVYNVTAMLVLKKHNKQFNIKQRKQIPLEINVKTFDRKAYIGCPHIELETHTVCVRGQRSFSSQQRSEC